MNFASKIEEVWSNRELLRDPSVVSLISEIIEEVDKGRLRVAEPQEAG
jgi:2,3,4,5-tetrahydropyridine-2-carboxylate N-succinyltransferase